MTMKLEEYMMAFEAKLYEVDNLSQPDFILLKRALERSLEKRLATLHQELLSGDKTVLETALAVRGLTGKTIPEAKFLIYSWGD